MIKKLINPLTALMISFMDVFVAGLGVGDLM